MPESSDELFRNADRRRAVRVGARLEVKFTQTVHAAKAFRTFSVNFSSGGLCLRTKTAYGVGDRLSLSITIEGEHFELQGLVAWSKGDVIGIRFDEVSAKDRERLEIVAKALELTSPRVP